MTSPSLKRCARRRGEDIERPAAKSAPGKRREGAQDGFQSCRRGARGTYRKSAARFEESAYDARMPESMRALAEKSVAHTRELYVHSFEAVLSGLKRSSSRLVRAPSAQS